MESRRELVALLIGCVLAAGLYFGGQVASTTNQIQGERHAACVDQNDRHDATIRQLLSEFHLPPTLTVAQAQQELAQRPKDQRQGFYDTILLINALAPHQDCSQVAPK